MSTASGRAKRCARPNSPSSAVLKWRALKRPVFGSMRASSSSLGTASDRWTTRSGASANGTSQGSPVQSPATATPSAASTTSVVSPCVEKIPVSRSEQRRMNATIGAEMPACTATSSVMATSPAAAASMFSARTRSRARCAPAYAASTASV